ncbi:hypothetical protein GCL60_12915 [Silvanigrella paludirubra]|uniref:Uncharacterized protein n=1 Tax=Silvanigrella paludirubra TaxID=2499159 RepID=A0A6N6VSS8_9BACT|nr:hypothetical protein [Silvanigrella paludirubra]KAB8038068.1 hypothetical protein GCL60_12915 [Silvanigrella paludirubra]
MSNTTQDIFDEFNEDSLESYALDLEPNGSLADDSNLNVNLTKQIEQILDSITRVGGEVCKLRAEMDGLLDQNGMLVDSFHRLKDVLNEKGYLDIDDFQLACDVFDESNLKSVGSQFIKKVSH